MTRNHKMATAAGAIALLAFVLASTATESNSAGGSSPVNVGPREGPRRIDFVRSIVSERDLRPRRSLWNRMVDIVAGAPSYRGLVRPHSVITDSTGRILVTDPGALVVHIFDFERKKYTHLEGARRERFASPIGIAVDAQDNIYVTDSRLGRIFVFDSRGKFTRFLAEKKGEAIFKRPTGIAIDAHARRIYVCDTLEHKVFVLDFEGTVLAKWGGRGTQPGQFNYPTALALHAGNLMVVDTMNFRVQTLDANGKFLGMFGALGDRNGTLNRPKGIATDSEGNIYIPEALFETVQIFNARGQLLYYFGRGGRDTGEFQLPAGIWIDPRDRIYVADAYNHRVQIFQFVGPGQRRPEAGP